MRIVVATSNPGKVREILAILGNESSLAGAELLSVDAAGVSRFDYDETGDTFAENAIGKAAAAAAATGMAAIADDSGLCVDALGGAPGVRSARWLGPDATDSDRCNALLSALDGVPEALRTARFVCAAALAAPGREVVVVEGTCEGWISSIPKGANGFGYDPLFRLPGAGLTLAEMSTAEKNVVSHRRAALAALIPYLKALEL